MLPRVILHWKIASETNKETETVELLSLKLFRFGLLMFILALAFGAWFWLGYGLVMAWLWLGYGISGRWLHTKLMFVSCLFIYFSLSGWFMYRAMKYQKFISTFRMRVFNESSLLFVIPIIYLAVSKNI